MSRNYINAIIISNSLNANEILDAVYDGFGGYNLIKDGSRIGYIENNDNKNLYSSFGLTFKVKAVATINQYAMIELANNRLLILFEKFKEFFSAFRLRAIKKNNTNFYNKDYRQVEIAKVDNSLSVSDELSEAKMKSRLNRFYERT